MECPLDINSPLFTWLTPWSVKLRKWKITATVLGGLLDICSLLSRPWTWKTHSGSHVYSRKSRKQIAIRVIWFYELSRDHKKVKFGECSFWFSLPSKTPLAHDTSHAITTLTSWIFEKISLRSLAIPSSRWLRQSELLFLCKSINYTPLYCHRKWTSLSPRSLGFGVAE